ncbi:MAG: flagellar biosynthesis anti-sigma factor FlgM [Nitrosomonas sp.]|nr:flagellar biosynthesis anti-sigma factor FlgM [Nitrosomonas sp.]
MKIDNSIHTMPNVAQGENKKPADATSAQDVRHNNVSSPVHISPQAANLQSINANAESNSVVDVGRVEQIKQAISEGTFKVNPEAVTDKLLETAKELILSKEG